jgi:hypothetical protein
MISGISETQAAFSGYFGTEANKKLESGKVLEGEEREIMKKRFEEMMRRIQPTYDCHGKIIEYSDFGRHLDLLA